MHYRIQMREQGSWYTLGGTYDAVTADERVAQFLAAYSTKKGVSREFRVIGEDGTHRPARKVFADLDEPVTSSNPHIGSTFESFLADEGLTKEVHEMALEKLNKTSVDTPDVL